MSGNKAHFWVWLVVLLATLSAISVLAFIYLKIGFFAVVLLFPIAVGLKRRPKDG